jgi:MFS transporter, Spinster family, sphingosine-1-phosphate transporter
MANESNPRYLLALLTVILIINYADRLIFGVVLQDIKVDLRLSDTQLGFLSGIAFALFYALMGIPIARWADRGNRVTIIALCTAIWSVAVSFCGAATNFLQLMLARMWVAAGEAGCYPPSLSLLADHFERAERPRAIARYMLGLPLALVFGYFAAGWLNEMYGWRATFVLFGLPGVLVAAVAALTLHDSRRVRELSAGAAGRSEPVSVPESATIAQPSVREVLAALSCNKAFRHLFISFSVWGFFGQGILQWQPAFFLRSHGMETGELGTWFAIVHGFGGLLGAYLGGEAATRLAAQDERLQLIAVAVAYCMLAVLGAGTYLASDRYVAFGILAIYAVISNAANGPIFATTQTLVHPRMRALAVALMYLFCNLIGLGLGPIAVGALSDLWRSTLGDEALRYALLAFCPGYFWCAWHFWRASRTVVHDLEGVLREVALPRTSDTTAVTG